MDALWRLAWALPLVLLLGVLVMLILRRVTMAPGSAADMTRRMHLRESLALSDDTRVHVIEVDRKTLVVVESVRQTTVVSALHEQTENPRAPRRVGPTWLQRYFVRPS